jgi:Ca2+-binding EF-hand superfamily protein
LEISEIATGLGLLCGGNQIEKMKAGFDLFDENEDKVLSFQETVNYMGSFFKVMQTDSPNLDVYNKDPYHYAYALAISIFQESGIPLDGFLEFYCLKVWVQSLHK